MNEKDDFDQLAENIELKISVAHEVDAILVLDSVIHGTTSGGVRISEDVSEDEVHALAREMTLKYSFFGLRRGGAKCGIRLKSTLSSDQRVRALKEFGRHVAPIIAAGLYYPGMDMNCSFSDLKNIYLGAGIKITRQTDTAYYTAMSVAQVLDAVGNHAGGSAPLTFSIAGFGRVAWHLLKIVDRSRFKLVGFSTAQGACYDASGFNMNEVLEQCKIHGDEFVLNMGKSVLPSRDAIYSCSVDILLPSARTDAIHSQNVDTLDTRYIVSIANKPFTKDALSHLEGRGVFCFPGFVCNGGGVFASGLSDAGISESRILQLCTGPYRTLMREILDKSVSSSKSIHEIARELAYSTHLRLRSEKVALPDRLLKRFGNRFAFTRKMMSAKMLLGLERQLMQHVHAVQAMG